MKYNLTGFFFKFFLIVGVVIYTWFIIWYYKMFPILTSPLLVTLVLFLIIFLDMLTVVWLLLTFARKIYIKNDKLIIKDFLVTRRFDIKRVVMVDICNYKSYLAHNTGIKVYLLNSEFEFGGFVAIRRNFSERITEEIVIKLNLDIDDQKRKLGLKK